MTLTLTPVCYLGYTVFQVKEMLGDRFEEFTKWMRGQTMSVCEGRSYNHDTKQYEVACDGVAHGVIIYPWDVQRFVDGLPVID